MDDSKPLNSPAIHSPFRFSYVVALLFLIAIVFSWQIITTRFNRGVQYSMASFEKLTHFTGEKPYQYRMLMPAIARSIEKGLNIFNIQLNLKDFFFTTDCLFLFLSWLFFALLLKNVLQFSFEITLVVALSIFVPVCFIFVLPSKNLLYPSDIPQILFFVIALKLFITGKIKLFIPLFILCTLNRETSLFLLPMLLLSGRWKSGKRKKIWLTVSLLFAAWVAIKFSLSLLIPHTGSDFVFTLYRNYFDFSHFDLVRWMQWLAGSLFGMVITILFFTRRIKRYLFCTLLLILPLFYLTMMLVGLMNEYRIFLENVPLLTLSFIVLFFDLVAPGKVLLEQRTSKA